MSWKLKKTIPVKDIITHPGPHSSRKGYLHKHNTLGETRIKYDGYKIMTALCNLEATEGGKTYFEQQSHLCSLFF